MISTCATGVVKYSRTGVNPTSLGNPDVLSLHGSAKRKQEKQKKNVLEIARQSGLLYDKFVNFVDDLKNIDNRIQQTQAAYGDAMNKLVDSK